MIDQHSAAIAHGNWQAPTVKAPAGSTAQIAIPGSKSLTNRYLLLAALASSPSILHSPLHSRDSLLMIRALEQLGASFEELPTDSPFGPDLRVTPISFTQEPQHLEIDCGLAGTVMRFVPPVAALVAGNITFDGDPHARERPMGPVIDALRSLGVEVNDHGTKALPFTLTSTGAVHQGNLEIDASESSQFVSALLLAGSQFENGLKLRHIGAPIPSMPHVEMTLEVLRSVGVEVATPSPNEWHVSAGAFAGFEITIEPDLSNAGPFLAAAVALGNSVSIPQWPAQTTQGGDRWQQILPLFGATVNLSDSLLTVTGPDGGARAGFAGIDIDLSEAGELAPTVASLCALAHSPSQLRGIAHLRGHETDRLAALVAEINRLGGRAEETPDGIRILAPVTSGGLFLTYADHRMATAAAVIALVQPGVLVENIATTAKTLPDFVAMWQSMLEHMGAVYA